MARAAKQPPKVPTVKLGKARGRGVAPSMFGLLERGVERHPDVARSIRGRVVLRFDEDFAPVRISFTPRTVTVEDGDLRKPDLVIAGSLPDIVHFATAPHVRGVPNPAKGRGRAAIAQMASRRVRVSGDRALGRRLLRLLAL